MEEPGLLAAQRLSAEQIRGWEPPVVMRGYERHAVEGFRSAVLAEITTLGDENREMARECERLSQLASAQPTPANGFRGAPPGEQAARILMAAQRQSEELLGQTQAYARQVGEDGERRRRAMIADGRARGESMAETLIREASQKAADIVAQAPGDAQERLVRVRATGDALEAHLDAMLGGLTAALNRFRDEQALSLRAESGNGSGPVPAPALARPADQGQR